MKYLFIAIVALTAITSSAHAEYSKYPTAPDDQELSQYYYNAEAASRQRQQSEEVSDAIDRTGQAIANTPRTTYCNSQKISGQVFTNCNSY